MNNNEKWVVEGFLEGGIHIPNTENNLPVKTGSIALARYAILEQNMAGMSIRVPTKIIYLGLDIPETSDHVCIAFQEMESLARAISIEYDSWIVVQITKMTNKEAEWPYGIEFLKSRQFDICTPDWQPSKHLQAPKNRIRLGIRDIGGVGVPIRTPPSALEERHRLFTSLNEYQSYLLKEYLSGLEVPSTVAILRFFHVLERVGKDEYGSPAKRSLTTKAFQCIINEIKHQLSDSELEASESILRWRHTKSEAHLLTEGPPAQTELRLCQKISRHILLNRL